VLEDQTLNLWSKASAFMLPTDRYETFAPFYPTMRLSFWQLQVSAVIGCQQ
jgi:hypothetical protein